MTNAGKQVEDFFYLLISFLYFIFLQRVFDELLERVKEKEEKEAKRQKRLADDFYDLLCTSKV